MEHTKHIWRAVLIILCLPVGYVLARHFLMPKSFGKAGHYRFDALVEIAAKEPVHGDPDSKKACGKCHKEQVEEKGGGKHAEVSCEVCHGPLSRHVQGETKTAEMPVNRTHALCTTCHLKLEARPKGFPQIDVLEHLTKQQGSVPEKIAANVCKKCHASHSPKAE